MKTKVASVVAGIVNGGILSISPLIVHSSVLGSGNVNIVFYSKTFLLFNEGVYGENIEAAFAMLCGLREVVKGAGILFNTEEELKNAIISLLNNNALYEEISQKCRDRAERYDIKRMAEDLIKLYSGGSNS
jgi:hypothetical protein